MKMGRPTKYNKKILALTREYIDSCEDETYQVPKFEGDKGTSYETKIRVRIPSIEGLAYTIKVDKGTIQEWRKIHPDFSRLIGELLSKQARALIDKGLSGEYNSTIAKVLLAKHSYRDAADVDVTSGGKPLSSVKELSDAELANLAAASESGNGQEGTGA